MLNAVLFDLDNTLIDRDRAFRDCVNTRFRDPVVRAELVQLDHRGYGEREPLFKTWSRHAGTALNQVMLGCLIAEHIQPDRSLLNALRNLSATVKLGIITNGGSETQRQKLRAAGLEELIPPDHVWVSDEVGKAKPDPAIFLLASKTIGEYPEHCLFIGDRERDDLAGATAAGMRARLVDGVLNAERLELLLRQERVR